MDSVSKGEKRVAWEFEDVRSSVVGGAEDDEELRGM